MATKIKPGKKSLIISLLILTIYILSIVIQELWGIKKPILLHIGLGCVVFIVSYFFIYHWFLNFVKESVSPIYKALGKEDLSRFHLRKKLISEKLTGELVKEVNTWTSDQKKELRQLREMEKYRKDFLGNVSHELKTPIFNIQGYILTLLDGGMNDKKVNRLYLERAEKSINRMISIVEDLGSISRLESGELKLNPENFNIVRLVEDVFEVHEMLASNFKIKLEFDKHYGKPIKVRADKRRITEVLSNLVSNSINYGKYNGKTKVGFIDNGDSVVIEISDNGIGIAEEDLHRIFERFYRVDKSRSRDSGGTGLGLSIVKHIIQAHKQSIEVKSTVEKGSVFSFTLEKS